MIGGQTTGGISKKKELGMRKFFPTQGEVSRMGSRKRHVENGYGLWEQGGP